ncbi:putative vacuolar protein sorting-associated protein 41 [Trypanosoma cruzi]|nr:putative vacuolar protein sorting-associated protein 41 [Trypanosoma cruzi]
MNVPIASCFQQRVAGIQNILCLCTVDFTRVLVSCLGTTDLFLLDVGSNAIEIDYIYVVNLGAPATKLRHVFSMDVTFVLSNGVLYSATLRKKAMNSPQEMFTLSEGIVTDFDIVIVKEGACISILEAPEISVFFYTRNGKFLLSRFNAGNISSCNWVTMDCLCCSGEGILHIYGADGSYMHRLGSQTAPARYAIPLFECFSSNDKSSCANKRNVFAVLFENSELYFAYYFTLFSQVGDVFTGTFRFPIFSSSLPTCIFSVGPWICVSSSFGLEFYDHKTGSYAQSALENESSASYSFANISFDATLVPSDILYSRSRFGVVVTKNALYLLCLRSILDIVDELKGDAAFHTVLLESLKSFGESVRATNITRSYCRCDTISSLSILFSDYGSILAKFRISLWEFKAQNSDVGESKKQGSSCAICGLESFFSLNFYNCALCHLVVCRKCSFLRNLRLYGYFTMSGKGVLCAHCDGGCDLNLYRLFMSRRYNQILHYMEEYPERCYKLSLSEVIPSVLLQCFGERKFDLCAELIEKYIPKNDSLWDQWVVRFSVQNQIECLARVHNPNRTDQAINTGLLLQLVKSVSYELYVLLQQWPGNSYSAEMVLHGILSRLSYKKQEAYDLQESCQCGPLNLLEWQNAVSEIYFDDDINQLLRAYLYICFQNEKHLDAAKGYMEYFVMMLPLTKEQRQRSYEVFEGSILRGESLSEFPPSDLINLWDLLASHGILEEFIWLKDSGGKTLFLIPLLTHYREEFVRYLIDSVHADLLEDILQSTVYELKDQPVLLLNVLDSITRISPLATRSYHSLMTELYLEHAPEKLLSFIQQPQVGGLNLKKLARIVENRKMFRELVYLVGKTGNDMEAIRMAIRCMKSVPLAMEYIKDHPDDTRLWDLVMTNVVQSPVLIADFLEAAGDLVDMKAFLRSIPTPNRLNIFHGGPRLKKVLQGKSCFERIARSSVDSISVDNYVSLIRLRQQNCRGARCIPGDLCSLCGQLILGEYMVTSSGAAFHSGCTPPLSLQYKKHENKINHQYGRPSKNRRDVSKMDYIEYHTNRSLCTSNPVKLLPEKEVYRILSFLSPNEREVFRDVSREFRKVVKSFHIFAKREDDNLFGRYYARLETVGENNCRCTLQLGRVPIFKSLRGAQRYRVDTVKL